jgi:ubiquitin C-terminal hydrolase
MHVLTTFCIIEFHCFLTYIFIFIQLFVPHSFIFYRPKALLLHLKRFIVNDATRSFQKNKARIIYDKSLSLDKFCSLKSKNNNSGHYNLRGVVRHIGGTASSGHYTANCERWKKKESEGEENNEEWVSFDDGMAYPTSTRSVLESERNQRTAYMMMYAM